MRAKWLDSETELPLIDERVNRLEAFTQALADGVIDRGELEDQQARLVEAMKDVEESLDDSTHAKITSLLVELTAYNVMRALAEMQSVRAELALGDNGEA